MAFKRTEIAVAAVDLATLTPADVERRIVDGVRKYATNQENWGRADKNTPFLGSITGMGIESANLVDITMSIERQFLTRKTRRVPMDAGGASFRLEEGDVGPLMILEGQDSFAATPGLAVRMLMDLGHMPADAEYLKDVVSFAYVVVVGEGYRLNEALRKALRRLQSAADAAARQDLLANLQTLAGQARAYAEALADPAAVASARREAYGREKGEVEGLEAQLTDVTARLKVVALTDDTGASDKLRSQQTSLRLKLNTNRTRLRVAEEVAKHPGSRLPVEESKVHDIHQVLQATLAEAGHALEPAS